MADELIIMDTESASQQATEMQTAGGTGGTGCSADMPEQPSSATKPASTHGRYGRNATGANRRAACTVSETSTAADSPAPVKSANSRGSTTADPLVARQLPRIAASGRSLFEQRVWALLCQIPTGQVTTYGCMAARLGSSPRAVGNALRRNPFAPDVPCHRCVATGGGLGGFKGVGRARPTPAGARYDVAECTTLAEKRALLRKEGIQFDDRGRVRGTPFAAWV